MRGVGPRGLCVNLCDSLVTGDDQELAAALVLARDCRNVDTEHLDDRVDRLVRELVGTK